MSTSEPARAALIPKTYVADLQEGASVVTYFLCADKQTPTTRDGKPYLRLSLKDATGEVPAILFDAAEYIDTFARGDVVKVEGLYAVDTRFGPQLKLRRIRPVADNEYDPAALVPVSPFDVEELAARAQALVDSVAQPNLRALLQRALDPSREPGASFVIAPAAVANHHAYRHGLLEHSIIVAEVAAEVAAHFPSVDADLVLAGALLHDLGKTRTYSVDLMKPGFTDEGRLHGEIAIGHEQLRDLIAEDPDFPPELASQLRHILLSHHGQKEKGSPVIPVTREAIIVHFCDDMTARVAAFDEAERGTAAGERWSAYSRMLETPVYVPPRDDS